MPPLRILLVAILFSGIACAAFAREIAPADKDLSSLAEQLAPLIKQNPDLKTLEKRSMHRAAFKNKKTETPTPVENSFSRRASQELHLFGYHQIGRHVNKAPTTGQVQDDMIVGAGDER